MNLKSVKIIAVDFDGTLCENNWPGIGAPNEELIEYLRNRKKDGDKLILWTCRVEDMLQKAVEWCKERNLVFDAVNENLPEIIENFGSDTRKIFANEYIDDRNIPLSSCREKSNTQTWAEKEVEIACENERKASGTKEGEWDYKVYCENFLVDPENGDYDTVGIFYTITPEDCTVKLNRFFKEENDEFVEIAKAEYDMRKHCHGCFGAANNDCLRCEEELQYESE